MYQTNTPNPSNVTDYVNDLKNWFGTCPLFTKSLIFICSVLGIFGLFSDFAQSLVNQPSQTIGDFQITRLVFSPFVFLTIAELLLAFLAYLPVIARQEKENGTLHTIADFFLKNLQINLLFVIICYILSIVIHSAKDFEAYGLWCIFFAYLVQECLENLNGTTSFIIFPFQIPNKYYPIVLAILFSIISHVIRVDILVSALVGFLNFKFLNPFFAELLNQQRLSSWENSSVVAWIKTLPNYITYGSMSGPLIDQDGNNPNYPPIGDFSKSSPSKENGPYEVFGGSGIEIGGGDERGNKGQVMQMRPDFEDL